MKIQFTQDLATGRLTVTMTENCHGDSGPLINTVCFNGMHEKIATETAALAGAIVASRWCGEVIEFDGLKIGPDIGQAIRLIAPEVGFVQPIDGYRRNLCEGHISILTAPASKISSVLPSRGDGGGLTRLVSWGGEFVQQGRSSSAGYIAGEISTNADILLPEWEVSTCLGLLVGGLGLRSVTLPALDAAERREFERIAMALRNVGVDLRTATTVAAVRAPAKIADEKLQTASGRSRGKRQQERTFERASARGTRALNGARLSGSAALS